MTSSLVTPFACASIAIDNSSFWPDEVRGVPNVFARSGLIRISLPSLCRNESRPRMHFRAPSTRDMELFYMGEPLDESDLEVWLEIMHLTRNEWSNGSSYCLYDVSARELLRSLGRCESSGKNGFLLWHSIRRLCECKISISTKDYSYQGALLDGCFMGSKSRRYGVFIDPKICHFYEPGQWTKLDVSQRKRLKRKSLALWLHRFFSSFDEKSICHYNLNHIRELTRSLDLNLSGYRRNVNIALKELGIVTEWSCWIDKRDNIYVVK